MYLHAACLKITLGETKNSKNKNNNKMTKMSPVRFLFQTLRPGIAPGTI